MRRADVAELVVLSGVVWITTSEGSGATADDSFLATGARYQFVTGQHVVIEAVRGEALVALTPESRCWWDGVQSFFTVPGNLHKGPS